MTDVYISKTAKIKTLDKNIYLEDFIDLDGKTAQEVLIEIQNKSQKLKEETGNEVSIQKGQSNKNGVFLIAHAYKNQEELKKAFEAEQNRQHKVDNNLCAYKTIKTIISSSYVPPICIKIDYLKSLILDIKEKNQQHPDPKHEQGIISNQIRLDKLNVLLNEIQELVNILINANGEYDPALIQRIEASPIWAFTANGLSSKKIVKINYDTCFDF